MLRRVAVTGLGLVTSIGIGREEFWANLLAGRSGISPVQSFDTSRVAVHLGGEVRSFRPPVGLERLGRASQFAIVASRLALADAGLSGPRDVLDPTRAGVVIGTTSAEPRLVERFVDCSVEGALDAVGVEFIENYPSHRIPAHVADDLGFAGVNASIPTACAAGNYAIAYAYDLLLSGAADLMLAGASDAFSRITYTGFARLGAIAPEKCQPFDRRRKGMIPGEGAAVVVLEPLERAVERGARVYAEVAGYGLSCDAFHMTGGHPEGDGAARAMAGALLGSRVRPEAVSYISAHGTGTVVNDRIETLAIKRVFGETARRIPVSSIKSMIGHTMGAASAIEAAVCALAVHHDRIPATINFEEPDPDCDLDCVPNVSRELVVHVAVNNAYAFGGNNASVILKKPEA